MGFRLLNHAGTSGNYNTKLFESTEMMEKPQENIFLIIIIIFSKAGQVGWCWLNIYQDFWWHKEGVLCEPSLFAADFVAPEEVKV